MGGICGAGPVACPPGPLPMGKTCLAGLIRYLPGLPLPLLRLEERLKALNGSSGGGGGGGGGGRDEGGSGLPLPLPLLLPLPLPIPMPLPMPLPLPLLRFLLPLALP